MAAKAIEVWPGPDEADVSDVDPRLIVAKQILSQIPAGRWTNFLSLAQAIGTHRRWIAKLLSEGEMVNSHRVLMSDGAIPATSEDVDGQIRLLMSEGVKFDSRAHAVRKQHIDAVELVLGDDEVESD